MKTDRHRTKHRIATQSAAGFTLVEVVITLALIGVLAAIAAPSIGDMIRRSQSKTLARSITNEFRMARNQAMSRGEVVVVRVYSKLLRPRGATETYRTTNNAASCRSIATADLEPAFVSSFNAITVAEPFRLEGFEPTAVEYLCFQPDGRALRIGGASVNPAGVCLGEAYVLWTTGKPVGVIDHRGCGTRTVDESDSNNYWRISVWENGQITMSNK